MEHGAWHSIELSLPVCCVWVLSCLSWTRLKSAHATQKWKAENRNKKEQKKESSSYDQRYDSCTQQLANKQTKKRKDGGAEEMRMWTEKGKEGAQGEMDKEKGILLPFCGMN